MKAHHVIASILAAGLIAGIVASVGIYLGEDIREERKKVQILEALEDARLRVQIAEERQAAEASRKKAERISELESSIKLEAAAAVKNMRRLTMRLGDQINAPSISAAWGDERIALFLIKQLSPDSYELKILKPKAELEDWVMANMKWPRECGLRLRRDGFTGRVDVELPEEIIRKDLRQDLEIELGRKHELTGALIYETIRIPKDYVVAFAKAVAD